VKKAKLLITFAGHRSPPKAKVRGKTVNVAPGRSFDRLAGRYPVEPEPDKTVAQQIEATRTRETSFTRRQRSGREMQMRISNGDTDGVRQSEEMEYQMGSFNIAHNPLFAGTHYDEEKSTHSRPGIARPGTDDDSTSLAAMGDALGKDFSTFGTIQYPKMPHWMRSKSKWKLFCDKLAVRQVTFRQNVALLTLSFERVGHTDEEIFEAMWDAQGRMAYLDDDGVLVVPDWPFKSN
jgi:hypothetical protein